MGWEILLGIGLALFAFAWWIARKAVPEPPSPVPPMPPPVPPPGTRQRISIIVRSPSYPAADVAAYIIAQQAQISHEFAPAFGMDAEIVLEDAAVVTGWPVFLEETSDLAGALGYHDVTAAGAPFARVFITDSHGAGVAWQSVASHECLAADTQVPLLDGTSPTIAELANHPEPFWVYACTQDGKLRPGRGHDAHRVRANAPTIEVELDDSGSFMCTPDHLILLRNGHFQKAGHLKPGDSLMPLYRRREAISELEKAKDYEQVYIPADDEWVFTHRMVLPYCRSGWVRHHRDFNRFNNVPGNLVAMSWEKHKQLHAEHITFHLAQFTASGRKKQYTPEGRAVLAKHGREVLREYNGSAKHHADLLRYWTPARRAERGDFLRQFARSEQNLARLATIRTDPEFRSRQRGKIIRYNKSNRHREEARELGRRNLAIVQMRNGGAQKLGSRNLVRAQAQAGGATVALWRLKGLHTRWHSRRNRTVARCPWCLNHRVVAVRPGRMVDVYDLTVDKYHNFAIGAGVFVHNCLEILADPSTTKTVIGPNGRPWAYEVGDPVEDVDYLINGVPMSDFVFPRWFAPGYTGQVDNRHALLRAFQVTPGGYAQFEAADGSWVQISGPSGRKARK